MNNEYCLLDEALDEIDSTLCARDLAPDFYQEPALTIASLLRMMSRFPTSCSSALAQSITAHLQLLVSDGRQHPEIRLCAAELMEGWAHTAILLTPPDSSREPGPAFH